jgi:hypothetical protein
LFFFFFFFGFFLCGAREGESGRGRNGASVLQACEKHPRLEVKRYQFPVVQTI